MNDEKIKFLCTSCGACCRLAGKLGLMPSNKDGSCIHLGKDNKCKIYENRPDVCNVETMWKRSNVVNKVDYFKFSNSLCNELIKNEGLDSRFLIDVARYDVEGM